MRVLEIFITGCVTIAFDIRFQPFLSTLETAMREKGIPELDIARQLTIFRGTGDMLVALIVLFIITLFKYISNQHNTF